MNNQNRKRSIMWTGGLACGVLLVLYVWLYTSGPFTNFINAAAEITWNDFWINVITVVAAGISAVMAGLVLRCYQRSEPSFMIWLFFTLGLSVWTLAELTWMVYNLVVGEVPSPSWADLFWVITYFLFTVAFVRQYVIIYRPSLLKRILYPALGWLMILAFTFFITFISSDGGIGSISLGSLVNYFYPVADLAIALVALYFITAFRRGAMTRPWLGLFAFAVADSLYAWLYESGLYTFNTMNENAISAFSDTVYVAAYLILALGLMMHFLLVNYGPSTISPSNTMASASQ